MWEGQECKVCMLSCSSTTLHPSAKHCRVTGLMENRILLYQLLVIIWGEAAMHVGGRGMQGVHALMQLHHTPPISKTLPCHWSHRESNSAAMSYLVVNELV